MVIRSTAGHRSRRRRRWRSRCSRRGPRGCSGRRRRRRLPTTEAVARRAIGPASVLARGSFLGVRRASVSRLWRWCHSADPLLLLTGVSPERECRAGRGAPERRSVDTVIPRRAAPQTRPPDPRRVVGHPPVVSAAVLAQVRAGAVGVVEPALREHDLAARRALAAARRAELVGRERLVGVELGEQRVERGQRVDQRQRVAQGAAGAEALEVPRHVLAELLAAPLLPHVLARAARRGGASRRGPRRGSAGSRPPRRRTPPRGRGTATAGPGSRGRPRRRPHRSARPCAARRRPPRCRRCRAPGCRRGRPAPRSRPSRPGRSRPARRCARAARSPRRRSPGRSARRRGRSGGRRRGPCGSSS